MSSPRHHSLDREVYAESVYAVDDSQQLLKEIQEARHRNQIEISRAEETLHSYNRYFIIIFPFKTFCILIEHLPRSNYKKDDLLIIFHVILESKEN